MESFGANSPPSTNIYELTLLLRAQNKQGETKSQLDDAKGDRWKRNVAMDASGWASEKVKFGIDSKERCHRK